MAEHPPEQEPFTRFDRKVVTGLLTAADFPSAPAIRRLLAAYDGLLSERSAREKALKRAVYLARHLLGMIPREVWREQGGDDGQGHYEGDYYADDVATELDELAALSPAEAEAEQHAHAEHLREAREHQEEKHGE